jgi:hypothetical protein
MDQNQLRYAKGIVTAVKKRQMPQRVATIAIETALAESNLRLYANENIAESLALPHDAIGSDHKSVGLFQQQVGIWGTVAELMNPEISCAKFLNALAGTNWPDVANWVACQRVQNSAYDGNPRPANNFSDEYGGNYHARDAEAAQIVGALWGVPPVPPVGGGKYWVDIFQDAPVFDSPTSVEQTGTLRAGTNYVFSKKWGREVRVGANFNRWWLKTDPDVGSGHWVSAYYLTHWGNDEAKDNAGVVIPNE